MLSCSWEKDFVWFHPLLVGRLPTSSVGGTCTWQTGQRTATTFLLLCPVFKIMQGQPPPFIPSATWHPPHCKARGTSTYEGSLRRTLKPNIKPSQNDIRLVLWNVRGFTFTENRALVSKKWEWWKRTTSWWHMMSHFKLTTNSCQIMKYIHFLSVWKKIQFNWFC